MKQAILLSLMIFMSLASSLALPKTYVLAVGVSDYPGNDRDLRLTVNDARTIKWTFDKNKYAEASILINDQATKSRVLSQMSRVFSMATEEDVILLFFSGHGYKGGFIGYNNELISYYDIKRVMAQSKATNKIIFADACFSGKFRESNSQTTNPFVATDLNVLLFLSSRDTETSIERIDMTNGFFTTYLQQALRGLADVNKDRIVTAKELYNFVSKGVIEISSGRQHPVMWGNFSDSMPVITW